MDWLPIIIICSVVGSIFVFFISPLMLFACFKSRQRRVEKVERRQTLAQSLRASRESLASTRAVEHCAPAASPSTRWAGPVSTRRRSAGGRRSAPGRSTTTRRSRTAPTSPSTTTSGRCRRRRPSTTRRRSGTAILRTTTTTARWAPRCRSVRMRSPLCRVSRDIDREPPPRTRRLTTSRLAPAATTTTTLASHRA